MITSDLLKEKLIKIKLNNYTMNDSAEAFQIALEMMHYIGSVDFELRDELIYTTFFKWIPNNIFTLEQIHELLKISLDNEHLFYRIGEKDTDSVFTRTFSLLIVPLVLELDFTTNFLTKEEIVNIKNNTIKYLELEKDIRGYVIDKGWAHSTAHGADALDDIAKSRYINHDELMQILSITKIKICINNYTYVNKEDDRMATAIISVLNRNTLEDNEIIKWIMSFSNIEKNNTYPEHGHLIINIRNFLRSLYFQMLHQEKSRTYMESILNTLEKL